MFGKDLAGNALGSVVNASLTTTLSVAVFLVLLILAWRTSKGTMISGILGVIFSGALFQALESTTFYNEFIAKQPQSFAISAIFYGMLTVLIVFSIRRFIHESFSGTFSLKILQILSVVIIAEGILFVHLYKILHIEKFYTLSPFFTLLFGSEYAPLGWFLVLFIGLFVIRNNK